VAGRLAAFTAGFIAGGIVAGAPLVRWFLRYGVATERILLNHGLADDDHDACAICNP
jgi:hypothetical protein